MRKFYESTALSAYPISMGKPTEAQFDKMVHAACVTAILQDAKVNLDKKIEQQMLDEANLTEITDG